LRDFNGWVEKGLIKLLKESLINNTINNFNGGKKLYCLVVP